MIESLKILSDSHIAIWAFYIARFMLIRLAEARLHVTTSTGLPYSGLSVIRMISRFVHAMAVLKLSCQVLVAAN